MEGLRHLVQSPLYHNYSGLLERITWQQVEQLTKALPHDQYLFQCGVVFACRRLTELPHEILAKVTELENHANARARAAADAQGAQGAAFLNTPWYESWLEDRLRASRADNGGPDLNALG